MRKSGPRGEDGGVSRSMGTGGGAEFFLDFAEVEGSGRLARRVFLHGHEELGGEPLDGDDDEWAVEEPVVVGIGVVLRFLEGIAAEIEEEGDAEFGEWFAPDAEGFAAVFEEDDFPVLVAGGDDLAVVVDVPELVAGGFVGFAGEVVELVIAVDVVAVFAAVEFSAGAELVGDGGVTGDGGEGGEPIFVGDDAVEGGACREVAWPAEEGGDAVGSFPVGIFLAAERGGTGVWPRVVVWAVVGGVHDDGFVGEAEVVDGFEEDADV